MPNIALHGYGDRADAFRSKIKLLLTDYPHADETVIEEYDTTVETLDGTPSPYLRIGASAGAIRSVLEHLEPLNEDKEVEQLFHFIPKKVLS